MAEYTTRLDGCIWREADAACIPPDLANADYQRFLAWQAAGGFQTVSHRLRHPPPC